MELKRVNYSNFEEIVEDDLNKLSTLAYSIYRDGVLAIAVRNGQAVIVEGLQVQYVSGDTLKLSEGLGCGLAGNILNNANGNYELLVSNSEYDSVSGDGVPADVTNGNYFLIECQFLEINGASEVRNFIDPNGNPFSQATIKEKKYAIKVRIREGNASVVPAVSPAWMKIAEVKKVGASTYTIYNIDKYFSTGAVIYDNTGWTADKQATHLMRPLSAHRNETTMDHPFGSVIEDHLEASLQSKVNSAGGGGDIFNEIILINLLNKGVGQARDNKSMEYFFGTGLDVDYYDTKFLISHYQDNLLNDDSDAITLQTFDDNNTGGIQVMQDLANDVYADAVGSNLFDVYLYKSDVNTLVMQAVNGDWDWSLKQMSPALIDGLVALKPQAAWLAFRSGQDSSDGSDLKVIEANDGSKGLEDGSGYADIQLLFNKAVFDGVFTTTDYWMLITQDGQVYKWDGVGRPQDNLTEENFVYGYEMFLQPSEDGGASAKALSTPGENDAGWKYIKIAHNRHRVFPDENYKILLGKFNSADCVGVVGDKYFDEFGSKAYSLKTQISCTKGFMFDGFRRFSSIIKFDETESEWVDWAGILCEGLQGTIGRAYVGGMEVELAEPNGTYDTANNLQVVSSSVGLFNFVVGNHKWHPTAGGIGSSNVWQSLVAGDSYSDGVYLEPDGGNWVNFYSIVDGDILKISLPKYANGDVLGGYIEYRYVYSAWVAAFAGNNSKIVFDTKGNIYKDSVSNENLVNTLGGDIGLAGGGTFEFDKGVRNVTLGKDFSILAKEKIPIRLLETTDSKIDCHDIETSTLSLFETSYANGNDVNLNYPKGNFNFYSFIFCHRTTGNNFLIIGNNSWYMNPTSELSKNGLYTSNAVGATYQRISFQLTFTTGVTVFADEKYNGKHRIYLPKLATNDELGGYIEFYYNKAAFEYVANAYAGSGVYLHVSKKGNLYTSTTGASVTYNNTNLVTTLDGQIGLAGGGEAKPFKLIGDGQTENIKVHEDFDGFNSVVDEDISILYGKGLYEYLTEYLSSSLIFTQSRVDALEVRADNLELLAYAYINTQADLEYYLGDGTETGSGTTGAGWSYTESAGNVTVIIPRNTKIFFGADPIDGSTAHYKYDAALFPYKAFVLKTKLYMLGELYVTGKGIDVTILMKGNNFAGFKTVQLTNATVTGVSANIFTVPVTGFRVGQTVVHQNDFRFYKVLSVTGSTVIVDRDITGAASGILIACNENIEMDNFTIDGQGGIWDYTGALSGTLFYIPGLAHSRFHQKIVNLNGRVFDGGVYGAAYIDAKNMYAVVNSAIAIIANRVYHSKFEDLHGCYCTNSGSNGGMFVNCDYIKVRRARSCGSKSPLYVYGGMAYQCHHSTFEDIADCFSINVGASLTIMGGLLYNCDYCIVKNIDRVVFDGGTATGGTKGGVAANCNYISFENITNCDVKDNAGSGEGAAAYWCLNSSFVGIYYNNTSQLTYDTFRNCSGVISSVVDVVNYNIVGAINI